jgi:hypothetical protein
VDGFFVGVVVSFAPLGLDSELFFMAGVPLHFIACL